MDKELIDRAWRILPAEFKRVVKAHYVGLNAAYKAYLSKDSLTNAECDRCNAMREKIVLYNMYFGYHNLTSDAQGEEMLTVPRKKVMEIYNHCNGGGAQVIEDIFGKLTYDMNNDAIITPLDKFKGLPHLNEKQKVITDYEGYAPTLYPYEGKWFVSWVSSEGDSILDFQAESPEKAIELAYSHLFGSKCLPDEACNVASSDVAGSKSKPAEPKFNPGDKVLRKYHDYEDEELPYDIFEGYHGKDKQGYICGIESTCWLIRESDLEPYTEPDTSHETPVCESHSGNTSQKEVNVNSNRNLSQETANCDKCPKSVQKKHPGFGHSVVKDEMIDSIIKEGFRKHNRLYIAAMAMQGILSNIDLFKKVLETGKETLDGHGIPYRAVAKASFLFADALIAESEKGGES